MPSRTAIATDTFGMMGLPVSSSAVRTDRSSMRQYVNVPTTRPITRLLNGSRNNVCTTRGEYWLDACWMMSSEIENAIAAKVIVAPAIVLSSARALSTVDVNTSGNWPEP